MVRTIAGTLTALAMALGPPTTDVQAQASACFERDGLLKHLKNRYDETPVSIGLDDRGRVVEVLASPSGYTWTMVVTDVRGVSCVVSSGHGWDEVLEPEPGLGT